jgi:putative endonuclease
MERATSAATGRSRRVRGADAEARAAAMLQAAGWRLLARNVRVGRDEIDIVAVDPGPPPRHVLVEVRKRGSRAHGVAEESLDRVKRGRLRRAAAGLMASGPEDLKPSPGARVAVDLVVIECDHAGRTVIRHHRDILASE